jgi:hypothetical protein
MLQLAVVLSLLASPEVFAPVAQAASPPPDTLAAGFDGLVNPPASEPGDNYEELLLEPSIGLSSGTQGIRHGPPDKIRAGRLAAVTGTLGAIQLGLFVHQKHAWWAEDHRGSFRFHDDGGYSLHLDKVAHFHATALQAQVISTSMRWSGLTNNQSIFWGTMASLALQTHVEIQDGYNELWGFDPYDMLANVLGAGFFFAREHVPALQPFVLKWAYWPSPHLTRHHDEAFSDRPPSFIDDYLGQTFWVSARVHDLLPDGAKPYWPPWLCVAAGVGGADLYTEHARREYFISLDVDLPRLIPASTWLGRQALEVLNFLHLPAPAVRISPTFRLFPIYASRP